MPKFATLGVLVKSLAIDRVSALGASAELATPAWLSARLEWEGMPDTQESKLWSPAFSLKYFLSECIIDQNRAMAWTNKID